MQKMCDERKLVHHMENMEALCSCGCGNLFIQKWNKNKKQLTTYSIGHNSTGVSTAGRSWAVHRSKEYRAKCRIRLLGRGSNLWKHGFSQTKEYNATKQSNRRALKKKAGGTFTFLEWKEVKKRYGYMCPACGVEEPRIKLTVDHIIPISRGGSNLIGNVQPLCLSCNARKNTKIVRYEPYERVTDTAQ